LFGTINELPKETRTNFYWDLSAGIACGLFLGAINPFVLVQAARIGSPAVIISLLAAAPFIGMIVASILGSKINLHRPVRSVFIWDGLSRFVLLWLAVFATPAGYTWVFLVYYFLCSISQPSYATAMQVVYPHEVRGYLMGVVRVGSSFASIIAALAGGIFLPLWGPYAFFAISTIFGLISSLCFSQVKEIKSLGEPSATKLAKGETFQIFRSDRGYRRYMIGLMIYGFSNLMAIPVYVLFQVNHLGVSDHFVSTMAFLTALFQLIFYYLIGRWMDRNGALRVGVLIIGLNTLVPLVYLITRSFWPLWIAASLTGVLNAGNDLAALGNAIYFAGDRKVAAYNAIHISMLGIRGAIAPLVGPWLVDVLNYRGFFLVVAGMNIVGFLVAQTSFKCVGESPNNSENPGLTRMDNSVNLRE
jgi:MFS family permease